MQIRLGEYRCKKEIYKNAFVPLEFAIYLSPEEIKHVRTVGYCDGKIFPKEENLVNVLFHEFNHCVHWLTGDYRTENSVTLDKLYSEYEERYLWTGGITLYDEEFYNIKGKIWLNGKLQYNPINCDLFEANRAIKSGVSPNKVTQRIYHRMFSGDIYTNAKLRNIELIATDFSKIFVDRMSEREGD